MKDWRKGHWLCRMLEMDVANAGKCADRLGDRDLELEATDLRTHGVVQTMKRHASFVICSQMGPDADVADGILDRGSRDRDDLERDWTRRCQ